MQCHSDTSYVIPSIYGEESQSLNDVASRLCVMLNVNHTRLEVVHRSKNRTMTSQEFSIRENIIFQSVTGVGVSCTRAP